MFGSGLIKGLAVTLKHFVETYVDDIKAIPSRYANGRDLIRQLPSERGLFTIQYPEEKRQLPERFRYIPMLIYDTEKGEDRCTACGICAKVCPPQCIWIVRDQDEKGKPIPRPAEFYIDASICMSCGFCAEFCPFDAIKMNHDYELAVYERYPNLIYDKEELTVPLEYYASLYPTQFAEEEKRRAEEAARKAKRPSRRGRAPTAAAKPAAQPKAAPAEGKPAPRARTSGALSPEELERRRAEARARAAARKGKAASAPSAPAEGKPAPRARTSGTLSPEELERRRAEARARHAARKGKAAEAPSAPAEGKPAPRARTSGTLSPEELERRRAEARARHAARKGKAAGEEAPTRPKVQADSQATADRPTGEGKQKERKALPTARTSGGLTPEELERRRAEAHARYRQRKGEDAKVLDEYDE